MYFAFNGRSVRLIPARRHSGLALLTILCIDSSPNQPQPASLRCDIATIRGLCFLALTSHDHSPLDLIMPINEILEWPTWHLVVALLCVMFIANEIGFRFGRRLHRDETEKSRFASGALKASVFGMVALLVGFSFSLTASRHELRRKVVLDEANAIGTCYLRSEMLDQPVNEKLQGTLRKFIDVRIDHFEKLLNPAEYLKTESQLAELLDELWQAVVRSGIANAEATRVSQIVPAANAVIDLNATRAWATRSHLPGAVLVLLIVCVTVSSLLIGHSSGQSSRRHVWLWIATNSLFSLVMFVMLEYDRPSRAMARVDHSPLTDLRSEWHRQRSSTEPR